MIAVRAGRRPRQTFPEHGAPTMSTKSHPRAATLWRFAVLALGVALTAALWRLAPQTASADRIEFASCCVATIDLNKVLESMDERAEREKELQSLVATLEGDLKKLADRGKAVEADLQVLPQGTPEWRAKRDEAVMLAAELQAKREASQAIALDRQKRLQLDLFAKIREASARYAEREGFMLVLNSDSAAVIPDNANDQQVQGAILGRRVIFSSPANDISEGVARMMNTEFKGR